MNAELIKRLAERIREECCFYNPPSFHEIVCERILAEELAKLYTRDEMRTAFNAISDQDGGLHKFDAWMERVVDTARASREKAS